MKKGLYIWTGIIPQQGLYIWTGIIPQHDEKKVYTFGLGYYLSMMTKWFIHFHWDNTSTWWKKVYTFGLG